MGSALPTIKYPTESERKLLERLVEQQSWLGPDCRRFQYFGTAMMAIFNEAPTEQAHTLQGIIAEHTPITLDDMRACIDAAMILTP